MTPVPLRIIPELRPYHLQLLQQWPKAHTYYLWGKYDLLAGGDIPIQRTTPTKLLYLLLKTRAPFVEIWEPLWMRLLPLQIVAFCCYFAGGLLQGRLRRFRAYCLENNEPGALLGPRLSNPLTALALRLAIGFYIYAAFDRLVFASPSAEETYRSFPLVPRILSTVRLNLPARPAKVSTGHREPVACFVGQLEERKGIQLLIEAWSLVEQQHPDVSVVIIGDGELRETVEQFVSRRPSSRKWTGFLSRTAVERELAGARILIAPSIRHGRWREQIGLPIHDALLAGLTVVTTDETGLAPWLRVRGHSASHAQPSAVALAAHISWALNNPLSPEGVHADLPERDGRVVAAEFLHGNFTENLASRAP